MGCFFDELWFRYSKMDKKNEFDEIDRKTSKVMTTNKELHLTSDIKKWYVSRAEGVRYM